APVRNGWSGVLALPMRDLDKALADIVEIRSQIAAGTAFRGYGPATMAATGVIALVTSILQFLLLGDPTSEPLGFFFGWFIAAAHRGVCRGLVLHLRICGGGARKPDPHAIAMEHGAALRDRPVDDGGHSVFRVRRQ